MCGRFNMHLTDLRELRKRLGIERTAIEALKPRYNVAPSQAATVVTNRPERTLESLRWGLVPAWAKDASMGYKTINARVESIADKPSFRDAFARRRCVVPVTGFYEWRRDQAKSYKIPTLIRPRDAGLMHLAGLWDRWVSKDGEALDSFTIITKDAVGFLRNIHDRMPLELPDDHVDAWLQPGQRPAPELLGLLEGARGDEHLESVDVSTLVNSPANDDPRCLEPTTEHDRGRQLGLFD